MVRTSAFQADNPGSNPGRRTHEIQEIQTAQGPKKKNSSGENRDTEKNDKGEAGVRKQVQRINKKDSREI